MSPVTLKTRIDFVGPDAVGALADQVVNLSQSISAANDQRERGQDFAASLRISGRWLLAGDLLAVALAFFCGGVVSWAANTFVLGTEFSPVLGLKTLSEFGIFMGLGSLSLLWLDTRGHYRQRLPYWEKIGHLLAVALIGFLVCGFIQFIAKGLFSRLWLASSWTCLGVFLLIGRGLTRRWLDMLGLWQIPALIIGDGPSAQAAVKALKREPGMGFTIVRQIPAGFLHQLEKPHSWRRLLSVSGACHLFLALESGELEAQHDALKCMVRERVPCSIVPPWLGLPASTLSLHHFLLSDVLLLHHTNRLKMPLPRLMKRGFDIVLAGAAVLALSPLFLAVALMVRRDGGPAFFTQPRVGRNGKLFACYKFRSMRVDAEDYLQHYLAENPEAAAEWHKFQKLKTDVRITKFGNFIRKTSIDELPQLLNVLLGHMSLVGPRPIMPGQEQYYDDDFAYYESVRPGITGPWQVSGRNRLTFKERVALEACYARNWSFWMDVVIMLKTIPAVLGKDNAF